MNDPLAPCWLQPECGVDCVKTLADFMAWLGHPVASRPALAPIIGEHLVTCPACQAALRELAARGKQPLPLPLRALTERDCDDMLAELSACAELSPAMAAQRYPVAWTHIELCPFCGEQYRMVRELYRQHC